MSKSLYFVSWGYFQRPEKMPYVFCKCGTKPMRVIVVTTIKCHLLRQTMLLEACLGSRAKFLPWLCGTSQFPIALGVSSRTQRMLSWCDGGIQISARRVTESCDIQLMLGSGRNLMTSIIMNLGMIRETLGLRWVRMEWIRSVNEVAPTAHGQWYWRCTICLHGCARRESIFCYLSLCRALSILASI